MKKKVFSLMMGLLLAFAGVANAQMNEFLNEGFEGGTMPAGWTSEGDNYWEVGTGDYYTDPGTGSGMYNALISHGDYDEITYLVTPAMNLTGATTGTVSFKFINRDWIGDTDEFGVYYRVAGGSWNQLYYTAASHESWTSQTLTLTGFGAGYQIGFMYYDNYGYGIGVDDVVVMANAAAPTQEFSLKVTPSPIELGYRPIGCWMQPMTVTVEAVNGNALINAVEVSNPFFTIDLGENVVPFYLADGESFDVNLGTANGVAGTIEANFVVDYADTRVAKVVDLKAEAYTPVEPDVFEMARVINNPANYVDVPTWADLYDNYRLPGNAAWDGPDAVYKLTIDNDMNLNASVTRPGSTTVPTTAKIAVYNEDFEGVGGPDVDNNYTAPAMVHMPIQVDTWFNYDFTGTAGFFGSSTAGFQYGYCIPASIINNNFLYDGSIVAVESAAYETAPYTLKLYRGENLPETLIYEEEFMGEELTIFHFDLNEPVLLGNDNIWVTFDSQSKYSAYTGNTPVDVDNAALYYSFNHGSTWTRYPSKTVNMYVHILTVDGRDVVLNLADMNMMNQSVVNHVEEVVPTREMEETRGGSINNMVLTPGTYYIVASAQEEFQVNINASTAALACPEPAVNLAPADDANDILPNNVMLNWVLGERTTEFRLLFGTTYYCEDVLIDWTRDLTDSYMITDGLWNNSNYFWRIEERNDGCPEGVLSPVWGFTTTFNIPQNLESISANGTELYEGDDLILSWDPIEDRTFRQYNIYQDGVLIGNTPTNTTTSTYTVEGLDYNMGGYVFNVTALYDEGESYFSDPLIVQVSGEGKIAGHVYEQDGITGIANATVFIYGEDEFGRERSFSFTTGNNGSYSGSALAGTYDAMAVCDGYQTSTEPICGNPIAIVYNNITEPVDFVLHENFNPVGEVIAEYYPDPNDPESPYVKVYWGWNVMSAMIEDFETGDLSMFDWNTTGSYPWTVVTTHPYEGAYCLKSGGTNVNSASSTAEVTVEIPRDGLFSFYSYISCESSWDMGYYYMDGAQMGSVTGLGATWQKKEFAVTAGTHTFKWNYTKDSSVNSGEDAWFIDYIDFIHDPEPAQPGWHTYAEGEFNNALGSNLTTTPSWGYLYPNGGGFGGMRLTKVALFSDTDYSAVGGNYTLNILTGGATPDEGTVVSTMTVDVPGNQNAWVEYDLTTPVNITGNENVWVIWTANSTISSWPAGLADGSNPNGAWWNAGEGWGSALDYGVFTMKQYFTNRNGRTIVDGYASDDAVKAVAATPHFGNYAPVKGQKYDANTVCNPNVKHVATAPAQNDRAFSHFRVYRTSCYEDGPYTEDNTVVLACELHDTVYIDVSWPDAEPGVYKWGVGCVYSGNRMSPITWATLNTNPVAVPVTDPNIDITGRRPGQAPAYYGKPMNQIFRGTTAYVDNTYGYAIPEGLCTLDIDYPTNATSLNSNSALYAGDYVDGIIYGYTSSSEFVTFDPATGALLSSVSAGGDIREMAYDATTGKMYGSSTTTNTLYEINLTTGAYTAIGTLGYTNATAALVCDATGQLYGMEFTTGDLYKINKTNASVTFVGSTGRTPAYVQSAAIDPNTGVCYWAYSDASNDDLYTVNLATGSAQFVCNFVESCALCFETSTTPGPTPPTPGPEFTQDPIQEPRESPIVWSNCLDKNMTMSAGDVTINVLLNSADSPAGINVEFTNLNEFEQELYPIDALVLDETGFYAFDSFRRGDYAIAITNEGYYPIYDTVSIWTAMDLRYVMTEIIAGVEDVYVSHTGWAMWGEIPGPTPGPTPGGNTEFTEGFEGGLNGWHVLDVVTGEGTWIHSDDNLGGYDYTTLAHTGTGFAMGYSYVDYVGSCNIDSYLYTPQKYSIVNGSTLSFWADNANDSYPEDFSVCVATADNPTAADFTQIWSGGAKAGKGGAKAAVRHDANRYENWRHHTIDLSAYAGQDVYIAFHDVNYDAYEIWIDDVELSAGRNGGDRHIEYYKVMCTSIDGEHIFSANTTHPFAQVNVEDLVEGEHYLCKVAVMYSTGMSEWSTPVEWAYSACDNWAGTVDGVTVEPEGEGNLISWTYPGGSPLPPTPGSGDEWIYDFENSSMADWTTIDADNDGYNWMLLTQKLSGTGYGHNASNDGVLSQSYDNNYGVLYPDNYLVSPLSAITTGSTFSFWACGQDANYAAEHFGVAISTASNTNPADFTTIYEHTIGSKGARYDGPRGTRDQSAWIQYTVDLSAYAGQNCYIAIRHFNCHDEFYLDVDDIQLSIARANRDDVVFDQAQFVTDPGQINGHDASNLQGAQSTFGPNVNFASSYFLGDDFTLDAATTITGIEVFGYQTGSTTTSTFTGLYAEIYDGNPMSGGNVIWGDETTNIMTATDWTDCYRANNDNGTTRPIMSIRAEGLSIDLEAGTYYLVWSLAGSGSSGPWGQPVAIAGQTNTGDGIQKTSSGWTTLADSGCGDPYGLAMAIYGEGGTPGPVPPTPGGDVLGAMIFRDGEWLAFTTDPFYFDEEGGNHVYGVRIVYNGPAELPDNNEYYSMSCIEYGAIGCMAPFNFTGNYTFDANNYGVVLSWTSERGANHYNVYRSTTNSHYELIGSTEGNSYFDAVEVGTYYYQVTAVYGECESNPAIAADGNNYVLVTVTGIVENNGVAMYPNPTNGMVKIEAAGMNHITVVNGLGQVVYDAEVSGDELNLNMAQYNAGIYTVRIATENGVSAQRLTVVR